MKKASSNFTRFFVLYNEDSNLVILLNSTFKSLLRYLSKSKTPSFKLSSTVYRCQITKIFSSFLLVLLSFLFIAHSQISAATLLHHEFTTNYSGYTTSFGTCTPGLDGLTCNNAVGITNSNFPGFKCVEGEYNLSGNSSLGGNIIIVPNSYNLGNLVNIVFRPNNNIVLNHTYNNVIGFGHWDTGIPTPIGKHIYALCQTDDNYSVYLDNTKIFEQSILGFYGDHVGFQLANTDTLTNFKVIDTLPDSSESNTVPLLKQTSEPWQGHEYDTASKWSPNNSTINRWGCALTSAAMVFQYHGYTKLPDGTSLDPGSLNNWLNSQKDGYVGKGLVNWHALTRLSKKSTDINNISEFDALEFSRRSADDSLLETDLSNQNPIILGEPGHFVVATEKLPTTFAINDPYYDRSTLTEGYNNAYLSLNRFIPSNTDLSTILIVLPLSLNIEMKDIDGNSIGATYIQTAIAAADDTSIKSGDDVKIFTAEKPDSGEYTIEITTANPQIFNIHGFLYNQDGEVNEISVSGIAHNKPNVYSLTFDKEGNIENELHKIVSYQTILDELEIAQNNNKISNGMYNAIKHLISNSKKSLDKNKIVPAKVHLYTALGLLHTPGNKLIDEDYSEILSDDLHSIISSL